MLKKVVLLLMSVVLMSALFAGCNESGKKAPPASSVESPTAASAPVVEKINAFLKKDTALKKADEVALSVRNIEYDEEAEKFVSDFRVYLNDEPIGYREVKLLGAYYFFVVVELPEGVKSGSVYVTYDNVKSNAERFSLE